MNPEHFGPPKDRLVEGFKARTSEIIADLQANQSWRLPAQRAIAAVLFWMQDNGVTKRFLAEQMGVSEQAMGKLLKLDNDFKLSTIGRLADATGLDLFAEMAGQKPNISTITKITATKEVKAAVTKKADFSKVVKQSSTTL